MLKQFLVRLGVINDDTKDLINKKRKEVRHFIHKSRASSKLPR